MATDTPTTAIEPVAEENPYGLMSQLDEEQISMALDPTRAARALAGLRPDTLCYVIERYNQEPIVGPSVTGANVLAAQQGGIEVLDYRIEEVAEVPIEVIVGWEKREGKRDKPIKEDRFVPGLRASVRVRNAKNGNVSLAIAEQPRFMALSAGGTKPDGFASAKAVSKATRNAIMDHFAAVGELIKEFVLNARKAGRAYISVADVAPPEAVAAADEVKQGLRALESRAVEPLGNTESNVFWEWAGQQANVDKKLKAGLIPDIKAFISRTWGVENVQDVPAAHKERLYQFVKDRVAAVVPAPVVPPPAPAVVPPPVPAVPAEPIGAGLRAYVDETAEALDKVERTPPAAPTGTPGEEPADLGPWAELVAVAEDLAQQLNMDPEGFDEQLLPLAATYAETGDTGPLQTYVDKLQGLLDARKKGKAAGRVAGTGAAVNAAIDGGGPDPDLGALFDSEEAAG